MEPIAFETHPSRYRHWKLELPTDGSGIATLLMAVDERHPLRHGYDLKLNSYDLGVDLELADAVQRLRFEHPEVRAVVIGSGRERIFCAGANIHMLASSTHAFKVNFCKFTNETRLSIEDASASSGLKFLAACSGPTAGGGYELALACDEILLIDDGSSTVSLPEAPLLAVLPGTGGLTRVVDKRKVRRDHADVFSTLAEGVKGKRAVEWKLVDACVPKSKFADYVAERAKTLAQSAAAEKGPGITLDPVRPYKYVALDVDGRVATLTVTFKHVKGWHLRAFRELDDALLDLRLNREEVGVVLLKTRGDAEALVKADRALYEARKQWLARETMLKMARVLRRLDLTAKTLFAVADAESCFAGCLLELALAADRTYALDDPNRPITMIADEFSTGPLPMSSGRTRLEARNLVPPKLGEKLDAEAADEAGLVTVRADELDWDDTLRVAVEERASLSPDALTGMEASLRFPGAESMETKIFGRLSAWQNWIFIRPNATGERGALTMYGKPERPSFDWRRT